MWRGMTKQMLFDIYSVHKAFLFGHENFKEYTHGEFVHDIKHADMSLCSEYAKGSAFAANLSMYPSYIIEDDSYLREVLPARIHR